MYAQQAVAFETRNRLGGSISDSTPDTPPTFTPPDLVALCQVKRNIVFNLPTKCCHCGTDYISESFVERPDSDVMAYCKKKGGCGKSLTLFASIDRTVPVYEKVCTFEAPQKHRAPVAVAPPAEPIVFDASSVEFSQEQVQEEIQQGPSESVFRAARIPMQMQFQHMDVYQLHGIHAPDTRCVRCEKTYRSHSHLDDCDQNGWVRVRSTLLPWPAGWPTYNPSTHTWS